MNKIASPLLSKSSPIQGDPLLQGAKKTISTKESFSEHLKTAVEDIDLTQRTADKKLEKLASGEDVDIHGTMIALQEADISIRTMTAFRDKITDAYKNLINMAI